MRRFTEPALVATEEELKEYGALEKVKDLDPLMERIGDAKYVLLGEATHGTHEFYTWRTAISKRLIEEKGFSFIAVEGDWPDGYKINRYVKNFSGAGNMITDVLHAFRRWPTWMWANWEIAALAEWMRVHNTGLPQEKKVGFYGLDVYSLWESMETIVEYLQREDPKTAELARLAVHCFEPYQDDEEAYGNAMNALRNSCRNEVIALLQEVRRKAPMYDSEPEAGLNMEMNALVAANAEKYYRAMVSFGDTSWNVRDRHMVETLNALVRHHGPDAKMIVWEHNTHIGDARATDMYEDGILNVGQLVREQHEKEGVVLVGFGSYKGSVIAAQIWGGKIMRMNVPAAVDNSLEDILHRDSARNKLMVFDRMPRLRDRFNTWLDHRAIGVVYHPDREIGNYVPTRLPSRYDAFLYIDHTKALHPLHFKPEGHLVPETYPFGV